MVTTYVDQMVATYLNKGIVLLLPEKTSSGRRKSTKPLNLYITDKVIAFNSVLVN